MHTNTHRAQGYTLKKHVYEHKWGSRDCTAAVKASVLSCIPEIPHHETGFFFFSFWHCVFFPSAVTAEMCSVGLNGHSNEAEGGCRVRSRVLLTSQLIHCGKESKLKRFGCKSTACSIVAQK